MKGNETSFVYMYMILLHPTSEMILFEVKKEKNIKRQQWSKKIYIKKPEHFVDESKVLGKYLYLLENCYT